MGSEARDISTLWYRSGDSERFLTAEPVFPEEMDSEHLEDGLTDEDRRSLCVMPTLEEVQETVFSIDPDSVAGPDGFRAVFFHTCWEIISEDVFGAVTVFFHGVEMPKGFTATTISLIPKTASPTCWSEYHSAWACLTEDANVFFMLDMAKAYDRVSWEFLYQAPGWIRVSHLAYADDLMIFITTCRQNMELLRDFLRAYERVSGQLINGSKNSFIVGRQASSLQTQAVQDVLGYRLKHLPVTYLGLPLYKGNRKACLFDSIISRPRDMLQGWAMMNLSHGGRLALIRSVLQATPLHLLQVIHPPKSVLITIERIFNGFFWGSYNGRKHIHWSSWAKTCFPMAEGGLGVRSLADDARAFSMRLWWRFRAKSSLWSEYLHGHYCRNEHPTIVPYNRSVSFWHDNWLGEKPLAQLLHRDTYTMEPQARGIRLCGWGLVRGISRRNRHGKLFDKLHLDGSYLQMSGTIPCGQQFQFSCGGFYKIEFQWTRGCDKRGSGFHLNVSVVRQRRAFSHLFIKSTAVQGVWQHFVGIFGLCLCDTWSLTHMRNAAKYRRVPFLTDGIILEVQRHLCTLYAARTLTSTQWKGDLHQAAVIDGSSLGNPGLVGAAGIIRDSAGHVHLAYQFASGTGASVLAKLTAVWRGMELALTHGLAPLVVEVDATTVISLFKSRVSGKWEVQHLIMRIVYLQ
ncbi:hypothetical protein Sango_2318800 [Sesamum angolense]|uniref:RNase H type-1 domain-containing protein n=1 Tax=Sesamum angolense TaxID=2727404 RepID=A0AAE1WAN8_9LAMI|nr:hypothetical protein Sango_2318800 [Sesamum angolense]